MAYSDIMSNLDDDLDCAYDESGETWFTDAGNGDEFVGLSTTARNDQDFEVVAQERTIEERELRWRDTEMGTIDPRSRLYWQDHDSYWMTNDVPEHIEGEYITQVRRVNIATVGAIQ